MFANKHETQSMATDLKIKMCLWRPANFQVMLTSLVIEVVN